MKKVFLFLLIISIVFSFAVPFAYASDRETKEVQFYNYNGAIVPDITEVWDSDEFPYALLRSYSSSDTVYIWFSDRPIKYNSAFYTDIDVETKYYQVTLTGTPDDYISQGEVEWRRGSVKVSSGRTQLSTYSSSNIYWSNEDIAYLNDSQNIFLFAFASIFDKTVSYSVNSFYVVSLYDYNGIVVPDITTLDNYDLSSYPYVCLGKSGVNVTLMLFQSAPYVNGNYLIASSNGIQIRCTRSLNYFANGLPWGSGEVRELSADYSAGYFGGEERWSNVDLSDKDGNIVYTYVAPVPIINDVSYLDNADVMVNSSTHWINALAVSITQTPFILAFVLVAFVGLSIRIILRLKK